MARALARIPGPRHPDDDPVLPLADAAAGLSRRALRHDLPRSAARRARAARASASSTDATSELVADRRGARRLPAGRRRRAPARRRRRAAVDAARAPGGACADDLRDRGRRPHAARSRSSDAGPGRYPGHASTAVRTMVDACADRRRSGCRCSYGGRAAGISRRRPARARAACPASCWSASTGVPSRVDGQRPPHRRAAPRRRGTATGEQTSRRADARPRRSRARRAGRRGRGAPGRGRRRSDEDGERAAIAEGRTREGGQCRPGTSVEAGRVLAVIE